MSRTVLDVTLAVRSPFLFASIERLAPGIDASALRDGSKRAMIPGDHLRGHLRHAVEALRGANDPLVKMLFGAESAKRGAEEASTVAKRPGHQDKPDPGCLDVSDLMGRQLSSGAATSFMPTGQASLYHRVQIDENTGAAKEGMLVVVEQAAPLGAIAVFEGTITIGPVQEDAISLLRDALLLVSHIGAMKSSGFGEVDHARSSLKPRPKADPLALPALNRQSRLKVEIAFDRALLVDTRREAFNSFIGSTIVPGGAIKGAIAERLRENGVLSGADAGAMDTELSRLHISHAFPVEGQHLRDKRIPACVAIAKGSSGLKATLGMRSGDLDALADEATPVYPMDWKDEDFELAAKAFDRPYSTLVRQNRGRVRIDDDGVSSKGNLFTTRVVETDRRLWRFEIDTEGVDQRLVKHVLDLLAHGLTGIGRTGAIAKAVHFAAVPVAQHHRLGNSRVRMMLETPQVLTDPTSVKSPAVQYQWYLEEVLGAKVTDFAAIATRRMVGDYLAVRYRPFGPDVYQPHEVTEAGSVFEFGVDEAADAVLRRIARYGLPPLIGNKPAKDLANDWKMTPFVAENGYGAVSFDDGWMKAGIDRLGGGQ